MLWLLPGLLEVPARARMLGSVALLLCAACAGGGTAGDTITLTGHVNGGLFSMPRPPVKVCVYRPEGFGCVDTDELGLYAIEAPANTEIALRFEGEGLTPTLRVFVTTNEDVELGNTRVASLGGLGAITDSLGVEQDPDKGVVLFAGVEFVSAELVPPSGDRYYADIAGAPLEDAEWLPMHGSGGFLNVEPGRAVIRFSRPHASCVFNDLNTLSGWPDPEDPEQVIVPVLAGHHVSAITMDCSQSEF